MDDYLPRRVCTECRIKKVRCDGRVPACGRCSKTRGSQCAYNAPNSGLPKLSSVLHKGSACLPCRRKKKRCDGQRPFCQTCQTANKEASCKYEGGFNYTQTLLERTLDLEERLAKYEGSRPVTRNQGVSANNTETPPLAHPTASSANESDVASAQITSISQSIINEAVTVVEPLLSLFETVEASVPSETRTLILLSGDKIRFLALRHRAQLCLNLVGMKAYAVIHGDLSGTFVHPSLVHLAHLIGFVFWQDQEGKYDVALEDLLLTTAEKALTDLSFRGSQKIDDITATIQVCCGIAHYHLFRNRLPLAELYFRKAAEFARKLDLHMVLDAVRDAFVNDGNLGSSIYEEARSLPEERIAVVAQVLFLDNTIALLKNAEPCLPAEYESTLWLLQATSPAIWKSNLAVMRARATCVIRRARAMTREWQDLAGVPIPDHQRASMTESYWALLDEATELYGTLASAVLRVTVGSDPLQQQHGIALKCSLATTLAAKAILHLLLPEHIESRKMALDTACQVVTISEQLSDNDFSTVDVIMGAVWALASTVFLREHKTMVDTKTPLSILINSDSIVAALTNIARSYLRLEMTYPVMGYTRITCDVHFDPELKARIEHAFTI